MLTDTEKYEVIYYLGYPSTVLVSTSVNYDKIVVDRLAALPTAAEPIARKILERLRKVDEQLNKAIGRMSTKEVDDLVLRDNEADLLRKEKRNSVTELGALFDITPLVGGGPGATIKVCV